MGANNRMIRLLAVVATSALLASPVLAEKPEWAGGGKGHDKHAEKMHKEVEKSQKHARKEQEKAAKHAAKQHREDIRVGGFFNDDHRLHARTYYNTQYSGGRACPPGLAKKNNGCLPPGQAKKLAVGQPLPSGVTHYAVPQPVLVQLPPVPPGYRYVRVGNDIVLLSPQQSMIVDIIGGLLG